MLCVGALKDFAEGDGALGEGILKEGALCVSLEGLAVEGGARLKLGALIVLCVGEGPDMLAMDGEG